MRADPDKLVNWAERTDHRPFLHRDVACEGRGVDEHRMIANKAVVAYVRVGHDQYVAPDLGCAAALHRSAIDGYVFANYVVIAHLEKSLFPGESHVLRRKPNRAEREELIVGADPAWAFDDHVCGEAAVFAQLHIRSDNAVGTNRTGGRYLGCRINDGGWMNHLEVNWPAIRSALRQKPWSANDRRVDS